MMITSGKLAVSSWSWHAAYYAGDWSLLDQPAAAAALGLHAVECNDFMLPPPRFSRVRRPLLALLPGAPPELWRYSRATLRRLRENARQKGTAVVTWTVNSDFTVPAYRWPAQKLYLYRGLAAARMLRAPLVRVNLGGSQETPAGRDPLVVRRLAAFVADSQGRYPGVTITVENHWGLSTDIDRHLRIVDAVAGLLAPSLKERFGCCFDPGNMPDSPQLPRWWRELAGRANHYHLKTTGASWAGEAVKDGNLPNASLLALLQEVGYEGGVTIEFAGDGNPAEGVRRGAQLFHDHTEREVNA